MKRLVVLMFAATSLFVACSDLKQNGTEQVQASTNDSLFNVNEGPYRFAIYLPKDLMINDKPAIAMNGATGELHISIGTGFHLVFTQEQKELAQLEAELAEDALFTNKITERKENGFVYQQMLPSGEAYYFHYAQVSKVADTPYLVRSWPIGEYPMEAVQRMKMAASSIHSAAKPA